jgi:hypothetical protein
VYQTAKPHSPCPKPSPKNHGINLITSILILIDLILKVWCKKKLYKWDFSHNFRFYYYSKDLKLMASLFKWWVFWFNGNLVGFLGSIGGSLRSFGWNEHFTFSTFLIMMKRWIGWTRCTFVDVFIVIKFLEFFKCQWFWRGCKPVQM